MKVFLLLLATSLVAADHHQRTLSDDHPVVAEVNNVKPVVEDTVAVETVQPVQHVVAAVAPEQRHHAAPVVVPYRSVYYRTNPEVVAPEQVVQQAQPLQSVVPLVPVPMSYMDDMVMRSVSANLQGNFFGLEGDLQGHAFQGNSLLGFSGNLGYTPYRPYYVYRPWTGPYYGRSVPSYTPYQYFYRSAGVAPVQQVQVPQVVPQVAPIPAAPVVPLQQVAQRSLPTYPFYRRVHF